MAPWFVVVLPAFAVALTVRLDAKLVGPYFSLASLVAGMVGFEDRDLNSTATLRYAVLRRFFYPLVLGVALSFFGISLADTMAAGFLAAALLLWPAVFHPLPDFVSLRDWQVLSVWTAFFLAYGGLASVGWYLVEIVDSASGGDVVEYVLELARDAALTALATAFLLAFFGGSFESMRNKFERRRAEHYELPNDADD